MCRERRGFSNFKSEHVNLLKKMTYPEEKRTQIWSYNFGTVAGSGRKRNGGFGK